MYYFQVANSQNYIKRTVKVIDEETGVVLQEEKLPFGLCMDVYAEKWIFSNKKEHEMYREESFPNEIEGESKGIQCHYRLGERKFDVVTYGDYLIEVSSKGATVINKKNEDMYDFLDKETAIVRLGEMLVKERLRKILKNP